jgi:hypothetical protein
MSVTWSAVRYSINDPTKRRLGWCAHKHRFLDQAEACARRLSGSWAGASEAWEVRESGHLPTGTR